MVNKEPEPGSFLTSEILLRWADILEDSCQSGVQVLVDELQSIFLSLKLQFEIFWWYFTSKGQCPTLVARQNVHEIWKTGCSQVITLGVLASTWCCFVQGRGFMASKKRAALVSEKGIIVPQKMWGRSLPQEPPDQTGCKKWASCNSTTFNVKVWLQAVPIVFWNGDKSNWPKAQWDWL